MSPLEIGLLIALVTILLLATGMSIAFGLGFAAIAFLFVFRGPDSLGIVGREVFSAVSPALRWWRCRCSSLMGVQRWPRRPPGATPYLALDRWMNRVPGGIIIAQPRRLLDVRRASGSSPATCAAIGKMGIPEMRKRGVPDDLATGAIAAGGTFGILIPPSITMIVYGVATETSIGRLFLAGVVPGLMLTAMFIGWALYIAWRRGCRFADTTLRFSWREKLEVLPKVLPFLAIIVGILYVLYGGVATPSEAAGVGALFCLVLVAVIYRMWQPDKMWQIFRDSTRESVMIMMIIATSELFGYMMSSLYVTQEIAGAIAAPGSEPLGADGGSSTCSCWWPAAFLPPVAIILMTAPGSVPDRGAVGFRSLLVRGDSHHQHGDRLFDYTAGGA